MLLRHYQSAWRCLEDVKIRKGRNIIRLHLSKTGLILDYPHQGNSKIYYKTIPTYSESKITTYPAPSPVEKLSFQGFIKSKQNIQVIHENHQPSILIQSLRVYSIHPILVAHFLKTIDYLNNEQLIN